MKPQSIDTYRLTSLEEPSDEILSQLMREAAEDARQRNEAADKRFFEELQRLSSAQVAQERLDNWNSSDALLICTP